MEPKSKPKRKKQYTKRIKAATTICIVFVLTLLLFLSILTPIDISGKKYVGIKAPTGWNPQIRLNSDGNYGMPEGGLNSELIGGTWELNDNILTLYMENPKQTNKFRIHGSIISYVRKESTGFFYFQGENRYPDGFMLIEASAMPMYRAMKTIPAMAIAAIIIKRLTKKHKTVSET